MSKYIKPIIIFLLFSFSNTFSETLDNKDKNDKIYNGLKFRHIGPALMSGRISDIVIHPNNEHIWYVTAGSGGVWKTENAGTTWKPIFDNEKSYSIGCIALDPQNPNIVWVGTGENVGGRHVAYGDGIYRSLDGGKSWKNMGLKTSEHLSKIIIHPKNSNIIWVASQGPLWSNGGERGIYKSIDGGHTWERTLGDDEWVGATDIIIDPRNSDVLYAATWQRHRTVAGYLGGGPGSGIYKSLDGGDTWKKLKNGLPNSNMGKIGLAISPQKPDVIYAAIELNRRTGGVYRSENKGMSWKKMSNAVSGGTGPHYYQELYVSPHNFDELYLADNYMQYSNDGGKTFSRMNETEKHVDNHAVAFKKNDPNYILVGCDGGLYESFDKTLNWKFIDNLPLTQFYKIAVDDTEPFYFIYGGTQDNNTQGAPSRTDNIHGIRNSDWFIVLGGDGHQPATEPGNPNIVYAQWQRGNLNRHDRRTGENTYIKPQPRIGEKTERYNWDAPILVSPHKAEKIYFGSQRLWVSNDRGDSWEAISDDLTKNIERVKTPFFGQVQKWDNAWDIYAMSNYSTITSISESPIKEGLIYVGTDDGVIQITKDGGLKWRKVDFSQINGLPSTAFVNDIKADLHNENIVYAIFDNHKYGDYEPYLYISYNKGRSWKKISNDLPKNTLLWRIVQDHVDKNLLFLGSEFGVYFSNNKGKNWHKLHGGVPNISIRDIAIQKRENDLVLGTFGRGIYILDDYTALRNFDNTKIKESKLFKPRESFWYIQKKILGGRKKASQGDGFFIAENPPFGVELTYFLKNKYLSEKDKRIKKETEMEKEKSIISVPSWEVLDEEKREIKPEVWVFIFSKEGEIIRKIKAKNKKGFNRLHWDLTSVSNSTITNENVEKNLSGPLVQPDDYTAQLFKQIKGEFIEISEKVNIKVKPLFAPQKNGKNYQEVVKYWNKIYLLRNQANDLKNNITSTEKLIIKLLKSYERSKQKNNEIHTSLLRYRNEILKLKETMNGSKSRKEIGEENEYPTIWTYLWAANGSSRSTYGPTIAHKEYFSFAKNMILDTENKHEKLKNSIITIQQKLSLLDAPEIKH
ncbi:MAG: glycosyl hydrolase [Flavobacteriales bacterium]|nr:glycosyl hydrolase [Flavobacteriales bacterium]